MKISNEISKVNPKQKNTLSSEYVMLEELGSGSFGQVYLSRTKRGDMVAAKVEEKRRHSRVYQEYKIYKKLSNKMDKGIPKIYDFIKTEDYNIMIMELLGSSLEDMFNKMNRKFKLETVLLIADQILTLIEQVHKNNYIHRDIKPNNFVFEKSKTPKQVYILDFGLAKKYMINGEHNKFRNNRSLIGTARYASLNMHLGLEPSRRDDLESIGYMLIYFLKGNLPWQGIKKQKNLNHLEIIGEIKMCTSLEKLCENIPKGFQTFIQYCRNLKYEQEPDYEYLREIFRKISQDNNIKANFEWN